MGGERKKKKKERRKANNRYHKKEDHAHILGGGERKKRRKIHRRQIDHPSPICNHKKKRHDDAFNNMTRDHFLTPETLHAPLEGCRCPPH
jgi:hypothetical protein